MLHQTLSLILIIGSGAIAPCRAQVAAKQKGTVEALGEFTRLTFPGDDAFGYSLKLWQEGDQVFGRLEIYVGAPADPPTGTLDDVTYDPRTKQFSFSVRLSTGFTRAADNTWVPTHEKFVFKGVLTRKRVSGTLQQFDLDKPEAPPISKRINLRRSKRLPAELN
jgi:hypothetical protein